MTLLGRKQEFVQTPLLQKAHVTAARVCRLTRLKLADAVRLSPLAPRLLIVVSHRLCICEMTSQHRTLTRRA
jgi:hypothetical protein